MGGQQGLRTQCAAGFILGSGGAGGEGGALARFVPDSSERMRLIQEVAHACARAAQMEEAVELFLYAGLPRPALHILNQQMSDLTELALEEPSAGALQPSSTVFLARLMSDAHPSVD